MKVIKSYITFVSESISIDIKKRDEHTDKLTCLYIHGLGAPISRDVKDALSSYNLIYPKINYSKNKIPYYDCLEILNQNKVDFIIGHSIGGVMAYYLAKEKNIPVLLLCPAFGDRYKVGTSKSIKRKTPKMLAIIGKIDSEVNPIEIEKALNKEPNCIIQEKNIGHDISKENLKRFSKEFVRDFLNNL